MLEFINELARVVEDAKLSIFTSQRIFLAVKMDGIANFSLQRYLPPSKNMLSDENISYLRDIK